MHPTPQRHIVVVRHAKSDWSAPEADIDRPLNPRGGRDAPAVGRWIAAQGIEVDAAVVSPAARTRATWAMLAQAAGLAVQPVFDRGIYLGDARDLADALRGVDPDAGCAVLVGHMPGCADFVEWACEGRGEPEALVRMRSKFPTAAVAVLGLDASWPDLGPGCAQLLQFEVCRG